MVHDLDLCVYVEDVVAHLKCIKMTSKSKVTIFFAKKKGKNCCQPKREKIFLPPRCLFWRYHSHDYCSYSCVKRTTLIGSEYYGIVPLPMLTMVYLDVSWNWPIINNCRAWYKWSISGYVRIISRQIMLTRQW